MQPSLDDGLLPAGIEEPEDAGGVIDDPTSDPMEEPVTPNSPPLADAGNDITVMENDDVTLDGTGSMDSDGDPLSYEWTGPASVDGLALSGASTASLSFVAPVVDADVVLQFTLTVSDGKATAFDTVNVHVNARLVVAEIGPTADAGTDQTVDGGAVVTLDGSGSESEEGTQPIYEWFQLSGPAVALSGADSPVAGFVAPGVTGADALLVFELTVQVGDSSSIDEVSVTVRATVTPPPLPPLPPPPPPTDNCPNDPNKTEPGACGCGVPDADTDGDRTMDCLDLCPSDPGKVAPGVCGCGVADTNPSACGCSVPGLDTDGDGVDDCADGCPNDASKTTPGVCGCGVPDTDSDGDGVKNCADGCPNDPAKTLPGVCGCGVPDADSDADGVKNCLDGCPNDASKTTPGVCGCGVADTDSDGDGVRNCLDGCPNDRLKTTPGLCGCGMAETDRDGDATPDCVDGCPDDPTTTNPALCPDPTAARDTDWELYMLRLVNRARRDPAGEAARIGSGATDTSAPVPPLAFDAFVAEAANNHDDWMHDNFGSISSGRAPDSFSHYETLDGLSTGTVAAGTPSFTGYRVGERLVYAGYPWSNYGENIQTNYSSSGLPITKARIDSAHLGWWNSSGHRTNMLNAAFTAFGFHIESRTFTPPRGGLNAPFDNLLFATQVFGRPQATPRTHVLGLIYVDRDNSGAWTPREVGDALREGLAGVDFQVFTAGTSTSIAAGTTFGNGAFSVRVADGLYDLLFIDVASPGNQLLVEDVSVAGANTDAGDFEISP